MNVRKITSLTLLISFLLCIVSSVILYIVPEGRISFWSVWQFWGLSKSQWGDLHWNWGILLLLAGCMHIYYNWKPIVSYLKDKARRMRVLTVNFNGALVLCLVVGLGTYFQVPPMSTVLSIRDSIKDAAAIKYGEPPYGHAELSSLKTFSAKTNLDMGVCLDLLKQHNIQYENENQTILDIARANHLTPKQVYDIILPALKTDSAIANTGFPDTPPPNFGKKTITQISEAYYQPVSIILDKLDKKGIRANPEQSIKEIAANNQTDPLTVFNIMKESIQ